LELSVFKAARNNTAAAANAPQNPSVLEKTSGTPGKPLPEPTGKLAGRNPMYFDYSHRHWCSLGAQKKHSLKRSGNSTLLKAQKEAKLLPHFPAKPDGRPRTLTTLRLSGVQANIGNL
jgi:hypothetical protein